MCPFASSLTGRFAAARTDFARRIFAQRDGRSDVVVVRRMIRRLLLLLLINENVSRFTDHIRLVDIGNARIVEGVPFLIVGVLRMRRVMSTAQSAHVITDGDQIVFRIDFFRRIENELRQIQVVQRTIDEQIDLVAIVSRVIETFQLNDEHFRQKPQIDFLRGVFQLFTFRTIPLIVVGQRFFRGEIFETVQQRRGR